MRGVCGSTATIVVALAWLCAHAHAFPWGAIPETSGGAVGNGEDCTACHTFNSGSGGVKIEGLPTRYIPGQVYDFSVRVYDADKSAAGFELSAESVAVPDHVGTLTIIDADLTQTVGGGRYVTQTEFAVDAHACVGGPEPGITCDPGLGDADCAPGGACVSQWDIDGQSRIFPVSWQAPLADEGVVTFFAAGNAVDNTGTTEFDNLYTTYVRLLFAQQGDADGDEDRDLRDFAVLQRCFHQPVEGNCAFLDLDDDDEVDLPDVATLVALLEGPTTTVPAGYVLADAVRGGRLYDKWWAVNGAPQPAGTHPLYPPGGPKAGTASSFRCKECHGWDYKGADGAYGQDPDHATGIGGVLSSNLLPQQMFDLLKHDALEIPAGHGMGALGMSDRDIWDVVKMVREETLDTDAYIGSCCIDPDNFNACRTDLPTQLICETVGRTWVEHGFTAPSDTTWFAGSSQFGLSCYGCHGSEGRGINFGSEADPKYIGTVATDNPWEFFHKTRFGQPRSPMNGLSIIGKSPSTAADVGVYSSTLPTE